ncbi:MAG: hypothetical protein U9R34_08520 [Nanoarchaeota archaeon]|nr:hypothetical protein [Nanoarchaeota archaeon]
MYQKERFEYIGNIPSGELIAKSPDIDSKMLYYFKMPYGDGKGYINKENNIGFLKLAIDDIIPERISKAKGKISKCIHLFTKKFKKPEYQITLNKFLADQDYSLFYSRVEDGTEILCIPGLSNRYQINDRDIQGIVLATYPLSLTLSDKMNNIHHATNLHIAAKLHDEAIGERKLISDRSEIEKEVLGLVQKVNNIYETKFKKKKPCGVIRFLNRMSDELAQMGDEANKICDEDERCRIRIEKYLDSKLGYKSSAENPYRFL